MMGRKMTIQEMVDWGVVNRVFAHEGFGDSVVGYLEEMLSLNDGGSMVESKRLMNESLRTERLAAVWEAADALAERFVVDAPRERFLRQNERIGCESLPVFGIMDVVC